MKLKYIQLLIEIIGKSVLFYSLGLKKILWTLKHITAVFHDPLWTLILGAALFFPIRQLIWVLYVRRKQKKQKLGF